MKVDIICNKCKKHIMTVEKDNFNLHKKDYCTDCVKKLRVRLKKKDMLFGDKKWIGNVFLDFITGYIHLKIWKKDTVNDVINDKNIKLTML